MRVFGFTGLSGSGKTELLVQLLSYFVGSGLVVSAMKHAHSGFELDVEGKDSHRYRVGGASEVLISSSRRWALLHENRASESEPDLASLLSHLGSVDLVLVEGFKRESIPKLEVWRRECGHDLLSISADGDSFGIGAVATVDEDYDYVLGSLGNYDIELLRLSDIPSIARYILGAAISVSDFCGGLASGNGVSNGSGGNGGSGGSGVNGGSSGGNGGSGVIGVGGV